MSGEALERRMPIKVRQTVYTFTAVLQLYSYLRACCEQVLFCRRLSARLPHKPRKLLNRN